MTSSFAASLLAAFVAVAALPTAAAAKTFTLGTDPAVATIVLPDAWNGDAADGQVEALPPDGTLYLSAEVVASEDLKAAGQEVSRVLAEQKIELKKETQKVAPITLAGMPGAAISWEGKDADGPTQVHMVVVKAKPNAEVLVLRWGDEAAEKDHAAEIDAILKSLAPVK